ncbi:unnamed protein product [Sphagnum tenellum]
MAAKDRRFGDLVARAPSNAATRHASKHAEKQAKERERERERDSPGGRDETRGFDRWGADLRVATGTFARCFLPFGVPRVFLDRVWRKGRVTRTQLLVTTTYQGPSHRPELMPFQTAVMVLLGPVPDHNRCSPIDDLPSSVELW